MKIGRITFGAGSDERMSARAYRQLMGMALAPPEPKPRQTTEADWQQTVIEAAQALGWRIFHARPAQTAKGWRTPVQADGAGFPDLVLVRPPRLIVAELKSERGKVSDEQRRWLSDFDGCGVEWHIWRPVDWPRVEETLRGGLKDAVAT